MLLGHSHPNALHVLFWSHLPAYDFLLCRQNPALNEHQIYDCLDCISHSGLMLFIYFIEINQAISCLKLG